MRTDFRWFLLSAALAASLVGGYACGGDDDDESAEGEINATLKDFSIALDKSSAAQGEVEFKIKNNGPSAHEFVVVKTDLDAAKLPYNESDATVDEESSEFQPIDEKEDIDPKKSTELDVTLEPGHYVIFCNVPAHYSQGMRVNFTVN